jgi:hypothetical protein
MDESHRAHQFASAAVANAGTSAGSARSMQHALLRASGEPEIGSHGGP